MIEIAPMTAADIPEAISLWQNTPGISLRDADRPEALEHYLVRNPQMSFIARDGQTLIGTSLCGHDGRRGYLNHVTVAPEYRGRGIGRTLVEHCLEALKAASIGRCHLLVFKDNREGQRFWEHIGWQDRSALQLMSIALTDSENA